MRAFGYHKEMNNMSDHKFCWSGPAQLIGDETTEAIRRAETRINEAAERLDRAGAGLMSVFEFPITRDRVRGWLDERVADRKAAFGNTLWGTIRWDKSLGRPSTPRLADAFRFHHAYLWIEAAATQGEPISEKDWYPLPPPRAWDGPHDEQSYRVSVLVRAMPGLANRFWPEMRTDVEWEPKFPAWAGTRRSLRWPSAMVPYGDFFIFTDDILVLDEEYEVVKQF
jgi:hypothetical protein